ncbi:MAG: Rieske (2Fe-2S) protein, partial [Verrucomicrobiota bacterium]
MLITKQPIFKRYWYPVIPLDMLNEGPQAFELLGESIVVWKDKLGEPHAAIDRCCHRSAKLSIGWVDDDGCITCPYHGWRFDGSGQCRSVPQIGDKVPNQQLKINAYQCAARYGYVWV